MGARLEWTDSSGRSIEIPLPEYGALTVGIGPYDAVRTPGGGPLQAAIRQAAGRIVVEPVSLAASVDGVPIEGVAQLQDQSRVRIGDLQLIVRAPGGPQVGAVAPPVLGYVEWRDPDSGVRRAVVREGDVVLAGRQPWHGVVGTGHSVSRSHAAFRGDRGAVLLEDLGSVGGSYLVRALAGADVAPVRLTGPAALKDGDRVRLGVWELRFHEGRPPKAEPAPTPAVESLDPQVVSAIVGHLLWATATDREVCTLVHRGGEELIVGRQDGAAVRLTSPTVSRRHAVIRTVGERVEVEDLQSGGGTWLDDERIDGPREVQGGGRIRVGAIVIRYVSGAPPTELIRSEVPTRRDITPVTAAPRPAGPAVPPAQGALKRWAGGASDQHEVMRALVTHAGWLVPDSFVPADQHGGYATWIALTGAASPRPSCLLVFTDADAARAAKSAAGRYLGPFDGVQLFGGLKVEGAGLQAVHVNCGAPVAEQWYVQRASFDLVETWARSIELQRAAIAGASDLLRQYRSFPAYILLTNADRTAPLLLERADRPGRFAVAATAPDRLAALRESLAPKVRGGIEQTHLDGEDLFATLLELDGLDGLALDGPRSPHPVIQRALFRAILDS